MNWYKIILFTCLLTTISACAGRSKPAEISYQKSVPALKLVDEGIASWYGPGFYGRKTASGERFTKHKYTCAHRKLPFGTELKVTNLNNSKSIMVRVNDRGPFIKGRVIDLSYAAAKDLEITKSGTGKVKIEIAAN